MTSPAAVVTLTYRTNDVQDIDGIFLEIVRGGPGEVAEVRGVDHLIPGLTGMRAGNRKLNRRVIELRGFVRGDGATEAAQRDDYWDNRIILAGWFDPTVTGALLATLPAGNQFTIQARTLPPILFDQRAPSFASVGIQLESITPDWSAP
jgi:hypothetical protein